MKTGFNLTNILPLEISSKLEDVKLRFILHALFIDIYTFSAKNLHKINVLFVLVCELGVHIENSIFYHKPRITVFLEFILCSTYC